MNVNNVIINIKVKLSLWDAIKMRIAGVGINKSNNGGYQPTGPSQLDDSNPPQGGSGIQTRPIKTPDPDAAWCYLSSKKPKLPNKPPIETMVVGGDKPKLPKKAPLRTVSDVVKQSQIEAKAHGTVSGIIEICEM